MASSSVKGFRIIGSHIHDYKDIFVKAYIIEPKPGVFMAQLCYYYNEQRIRKSYSLTSSTPKGREEEAYEYKDRLQREIYIKIFSSDKHHFMSNFLEWTKIKTEELRDSSKKVYQDRLSIFKRYAKFMTVYIEDIKKADVQMFVDYLITSGRADGKGGLAYYTVSGALNMLQQFFDYCLYDMEWIKVNPAYHIRIKNTNKKTRVDDDMYFSIEECHQILNYLKENNKLCYPYYYVTDIILYYGLRKSELFGLKWRDIDFENGIVTIRNTVVNEGGTLFIEENTKTEYSKRIYPLLDNIRKDLDEIKEEYKKHNIDIEDDNFIFVHLKKEKKNFLKIYDPQYYNYVFKLAVSRIEGISKELHVHSLRHSTVNILHYELGMSLEEVADWVGHSSSRISEKYYLHHSLDWKNKMADRINKIIKGEQND